MKEYEVSVVNWGNSAGPREFFLASFLSLEISTLLSSGYEKVTSHMGVLGPVLGKIGEEGRRLSDLASVIFLKLFQLKIINMPRCHTLGLVFEPHCYQEENHMP